MRNVPHRCVFADNPSLQRDYVSTTSLTICNLVGNRFHLGIDTINVSELEPPIAEDTIGVRELVSTASLKKPLLNAVTLSKLSRLSAGCVRFVSQRFVSVALSSAFH